MKPSEGPTCHDCQQTEAACATRTCCPDCTHWDGWTADGTPPARGRQPLPREHGSQRGYMQHRYHGDLACAGCLQAHREAA